MAIFRIRKPWRHFFSDHCGLNRFGPRACVGVSEQRHRRNLARSMTGLAVLLQNREDVFLERGRCGPSGCSHQKTECRYTNHFQSSTTLTAWKVYRFRAWNTRRLVEARRTETRGLSLVSPQLTWNTSRIPALTRARRWPL